VLGQEQRGGAANATGTAGHDGDAVR